MKSYKMTEEQREKKREAMRKYRAKQKARSHPVDNDYIKIVDHSVENIVDRAVEKSAEQIYTKLVDRENALNEAIAHELGDFRVTLLADIKLLLQSDKADTRDTPSTAVDIPVEADTNAGDDNAPQSKGTALTAKDVCQLIVDMQKNGKSSQQIAEDFNNRNIRTNRTRTAWVPAGIDQFKSSHKSKLDAG